MTNVEILDIFLAQRLIGKLFRFDNCATAPMIRFIADKKPPIGLSPATLRVFCERVGIAEKPCASVIKETVSKAFELWPELIERSLMYDTQKEKLLARLASHRFAKGLRS